MHGKQYSEAQNALVREIVREIIAREFEGKKAPAAEAFGVTAASLGDFVNGKKGIGNKLLAGVAKHTGRSAASLLGEADNDTDEPAWGTLPGFRESERELRTTAPNRYSDALYLKGRRVRGALPLEIPVTVATLRRLLNFLEENTRIEEVADLEMERIEKKLAADIKRAETRSKNRAKLSEPELLPKSSK